MTRLITIFDKDLNQRVFRLFEDSNAVIYEKPSSYVLTMQPTVQQIFTNENAVLQGSLTLNGNGVSGESINIYEGSTLVTTVVTGGNGVFSASIGNLSADHHEFKAVWGSLEYTANSVEVYKQYTISPSADIIQKNGSCTVEVSAWKHSGNTLVVSANETVWVRLEYNRTLSSSELNDLSNLVNVLGVSQSGSMLCFSAVTSSNGKFSFTLHGLGFGDLNISVYNNDMLLQETYEIEDCFFYGINTDAFTIPSNTTFTSDGEKITATTSTSGEKLVYLNHTLTDSDNWIFENEVAKIGTGQSLAVIWNDNSYYGGQGQNEPYVYSYMGVQTKKTRTVQVGDKFTVKRENGVTSVYINDELIESKTVSYKSSFKVGYFLNLGRTQYYKNIKLKAL